MTFAAALLLLLATPAAEAPSGPVLLDFTATWCGPCQQMRPNIEALAAKGYPIKAIDIDQDPESARRYKVDRVPTFLVVDENGRQLARTEGFQPASTLARFYNDARARYDSRQENEDGEDAQLVGRRQKQPSNEEDAPLDESARPAPIKNPEPWKTVVRIKIHVSPREVGFGSGTVIYSTPEEAIILTCAHIFKVPGKQQLAPSAFNRKIEVHLFDGNISRQKPFVVNFKESVPGEAIDYDFANDVGLIRIRPGKKLPSSRVVPVAWRPKAGERMITVGCSHGNDATAWDTRITNPRITLENQEIGKRFSVIECQTAPIQGRSGGGLYTLDGYVAGVCDFADPQSDRGLYAEPASIYKLLDRNKMAMLYKSDPNGRLLAKNTPAPRPPARNSNRTIARAQSPSEAEAEAELMVPSPESLGIPRPKVAGTPAPRATQAAASTVRNNNGWEPGGTPGRSLASNSATSNPVRPEQPPEIQIPSGPVTTEHTGAPEASDAPRKAFDRLNPDDVAASSGPTRRSTVRGPFKPVREVP